LTVSRLLSKLGELRFEKFGHIDRVSDIPEGYAAHMDYDNPEGPPSVPSLHSILRVIGSSANAISYSRTRRGWHITIILSERLTRAELVALQSILGSDSMRESLNLMRCIQIRLSGKRLPKFWQQRWNILYDYKAK
jgi:hypothetical protein